MSFGPLTPVSSGSAHQRILFVYPEGNITNNPHFYALAHLLPPQGFHLDVLIPKRDDVPEGELLPGCHVIKSDVPPRSLNEDALITRAVPAELHRERFIAFLSGRPTYQWIIGIDRGIIEAAQLAELARAKLGLLSYEICFADECRPEFKQPEIEACRNLSFVICQDTLRGSFVCRENRIDPSKLVLMPVAGAGCRRGPRKTLMHEVLELPPDQKLLLYMGELCGEWAGARKLLEGVSTLPSNWSVILHHRFGNRHALSLLKDIPLQGERRILFSPFPALPFPELFQLLHSVDLGVALYYGTFDHVAVGKNIQQIGLASGKFSTYLQHGVPVLVNSCGRMAELVQNYRAGLVVDDFSRLGESVRQFEEGAGDQVRERAWDLFERELDVQGKLPQLLAFLRA